MQIACVLKRGPEYGPAHVEALAESVLRHNPAAKITCLTDFREHELADTGVSHIVKLRHRWPGWWSKIELFRPDLLDGPTLYLDLDTVVTGPLPPIGERFAMLANVYRDGDYGSGVMSWVNPPTHLYDTFRAKPTHYMQAYRNRRNWGDQAFIRDHLGEAPVTFGPEYRSYKVHCRGGVPSGTSAVCFHGKPRPWEVTLIV